MKRVRANRGHQAAAAAATVVAEAGIDVAMVAAADNAAAVNRLS
jgi:hypothetical protein